MRRRVFGVTVFSCAALLIGTSACRREADTAAASSDSASAAAEPAKVARSGEQIYQELCALCHMADGSGVPNMQPALQGNAIVTGDLTKLEAVIRAGSAALRDREPMYATEMPPFGTLSDEEIKAVIAYVRERFGAPNVGTGP